MLQRLDVPIQSLTTENTTSTFQMDYFPSIVSVFKKCKNSLENDRRLENFNWRLWRRDSTQSTTSTESMGKTWSDCSYDSSSSSSSSFSLLSKSFTFIEASLTKEMNILTTTTTSSLSQQNNDSPKFFVSDIENNNNAEQLPPVSDDNGDDEDDDDDDDSTLFGDDNDEIENTNGGIGVSLPYEFTKKQTPCVDHQRSLLSNMLLLHDTCSLASSSTTTTTSTTSLCVVDDNILSSSMKQHVNWEKLQNGGPAAGLMGITKNGQGTSIHPASSMTLLDTFTDCW